LEIARAEGYRRPLRVLVIDDERDIAAVLRRGLTARGMAVDAFSEPLEALAQFKPGCYDFVVTDIRMPRVDGFELYRRIRERDKQVRVYLLSAYDNLENDVNAAIEKDERAGFLRKPISYNELAQRLLSNSNVTP
jgi:DNA-binding response OmpR family regulator